jgi:hypothetical protein
VEFIRSSLKSFHNSESKPTLHPRTQECCMSLSSVRTPAQRPSECTSTRMTGRLAIVSSSALERRVFRQTARFGPEDHGPFRREKLDEDVLENGRSGTSGPEVPEGFRARLRRRMRWKAAASGCLRPVRRTTAAIVCRWGAVQFFWSIRPVGPRRRSIWDGI